MIRILLFATAFLFSSAGYAQQDLYERKMSKKDSILLNDFWIKFKAAISSNDKAILFTLLKFPFYCRPCIDDTTLKNNNSFTIKVTKKIFNESQYKLFFDKPLKGLFVEYKKFETHNFQPSFDDKKKQRGFTFVYTILTPTERFEGVQGWVHLKKINGKYKITGIDTIP